MAKRGGDKLFKAGVAGAFVFLSVLTGWDFTQTAINSDDIPENKYRIEKLEEKWEKQATDQIYMIRGPNSVRMAGVCTCIKEDNSDIINKWRFCKAKNSVCDRESSELCEAQNRGYHC